MKFTKERLMGLYTEIVTLIDDIDVTDFKTAGSDVICRALKESINRASLSIIKRDLEHAIGIITIKEQKSTTK